MLRGVLAASCICPTGLCPALYDNALSAKLCRALPSSSADTWETIKLNQCYGVYIEGCDVAGAGDNAIDMVAVQYGHVTGSAIHDANWCMYLKVWAVQGEGHRGAYRVRDLLMRPWGLRAAAGSCQAGRKRGTRHGTAFKVHWTFA